MQYARLKVLIKQERDREGNEVVTMPAELFRRLLAGALEAGKVVDEQFYLTANPDVKAAVKKGTIESGAAHYYQTGYFEDKLPREILVNEKFYVSAHQDIAAAVRTGDVKNVQQHFESRGYHEGRLPFAEFTLF
jgi:hypothetical protein